MGQRIITVISKGKRIDISQEEFIKKCNCVKEEEKAFDHKDDQGGPV